MKKSGANNDHERPNIDTFEMDLYFGGHVIHSVMIKIENESTATQSRDRLTSVIFYSDQKNLYILTVH